MYLLPGSTKYVDPGRSKEYSKVCLFPWYTYFHDILSVNKAKVRTNHEPILHPGIIHVVQNDSSLKLNIFIPYISFTTHFINFYILQSFFGFVLGGHQLLFGKLFNHRHTNAISPDIDTSSNAATGKWKQLILKVRKYCKCKIYWLFQKDLVFRMCDSCNLQERINWNNKESIFNGKTNTFKQKHKNDKSTCYRSIAPIDIIIDIALAKKKRYKSN